MSSLTLTELSQASPSILPVNNGSILTFHPEFFPRLESYMYHICSDPMFLFHSVCLLELALYRERIFSIHLSLKLWSWWEKTYIHHVFMTTTNAREKLIKIRRHLFGLMSAEVHDQLSQLFWGRASWRGGGGGAGGHGRCGSLLLSPPWWVADSLVINSIPNHLIRKRLVVTHSFLWRHLEIYVFQK